MILLNTLMMSLFVKMWIGAKLLDLIEKFITRDDKILISEITDKEFDLLISKVDNWNKYNNNKKHVETNLDVFGMHLLRCVLSERILEYKRNLIGSLDYKEYDEFLENGFVILKDYNQDKFNKLIKHITTVSKNYGWGYRKDISLDYDLQYTLHVDTFHPAFKSFRYLHDVNIESGPFSYVVGSHKNTKQKLKFLYDASVKRSDLILNEGFTREDGEELWNDSFRLYCGKEYCVDSEIINKYLHEYGLPSETNVVGKKNTVILADTSGFHRRHPLSKEKIRKTDRLVLDRPNPFELNV